MPACMLDTMTEIVAQAVPVIIIVIIAVSAIIDERRAVHGRETFERGAQV